MSNRRRGKSDRDSRSVRLLIEPLEARRLLAGLQVSVYIDQNLSRGYEATDDAPAANRLVYVDLDRDGAFSAGEPITATDAAGFASFPNLADGDYALGLLTNPSTQLQSEPTLVARQASSIATDTAQRLIHDADLSLIWTVNATGELIFARDGTPAQEGLTGITAATHLGGDSAWIVFYGSSEAQQLAVFDLNSGEWTSSGIEGLNDSEAISELVRTESSVFALIKGPGGNALAEITIAERRATLGERMFTVADTLVASPENGILIAIERAPELTSITLIDPLDDSNSQTVSMLLRDPVSAATFSADGKLLLATEAGVRVYTVDRQHFNLVAILGDATSPIAANAVDGRIVTGSAGSPNELLVWDTKTWMPVGRTTLAAGSMQSVVMSRRGDQAVTTGAAGIQHIGLAVPRTHRVTVSESKPHDRIRFGVQPLLRNSAPDVSDFRSVRSIVEDTRDAIDWEAEGVRDSDGDTLWYSIHTAAQHGVLSMSADGDWAYAPAHNFSGNDSAVVRVHDGSSTTDLRIRWTVEPTNDPPSSIRIELQPLSEDAALGTATGFVSIVDPDRGAEYRVTTSDPRFTVDNGRIFFSSGSLDFESEPSFVIQFVATDQTDDSIRIEAEGTLVIVDANDGPTGIRLSANSVPENTPGAVVGGLMVEDPDAIKDYEFSVSDPRFTVDGNVLKLVDGTALNFEREPIVDLRITARDRNDDFEAAADFALSVLDLDDLPTAVNLSRSKVEELTDGAIVGTVTVVDEDKEYYDVSVSDGRFEVVNGLLKLRDGTELDAAEGSHLQLLLSAKSRRGVRMDRSVELEVTRPRSPWQNPVNPHDVNGDGQVSPIDVLLTINELNRGGARPLPSVGGGAGEPPTTLPDVNGDGVLSAVDVLLIINELNGQRGESGGEGEFAGDEASSARPQVFIDFEAERRRLANSEIDMELEFLLDQLSGDR